jgi:hypothetical protein
VYDGHNDRHRRGWLRLLSLQRVMLAWSDAHCSTGLALAAAVTPPQRRIAATGDEYMHYWMKTFAGIFKPNLPTWPLNVLWMKMLDFSLHKDIFKSRFGWEEAFLKWACFILQWMLQRETAYYMTFYHPIKIGVFISTKFPCIKTAPIFANLIESNLFEIHFISFQNFGSKIEENLMRSTK